MGAGLVSHLDWLSGTFPLEDLGNVADLLDEFFDSRIECKGANYYRSGWDFGFGVRIFYSEFDEDQGFIGKSHCMLDIKGSGWSRLEVDEVFDLLLALRAYELKCTRLDAAVDDFDRRIMPEQIYRDHVKCGAFSGPRVASFMAGVEDDGADEGTTLYLGRRGKLGGGVQVCIYDKRVESAGSVDAVRWESRFFKAKAEAAWEASLACKSADDFCQFVSSLVGGSVEFWLPGGEGHLSRKKRPEWWETLKAELGSRAVRAAPAVPPESMAEVRCRWLRAASPGLGAIYEDFLNREDLPGFEAFVKAAVSRGMSRISSSDRKLITPYVPAGVREQQMAIQFQRGGWRMRVE